LIFQWRVAPVQRQTIFGVREREQSSVSTDIFGALQVSLVVVQSLFCPTHVQVKKPLLSVTVGLVPFLHRLLVGAVTVGLPFASQHAGVMASHSTIFLQSIEQEEPGFPLFVPSSHSSPGSRCPSPQ
jgi:hypothetical protein